MRIADIPSANRDAVVSMIKQEDGTFYQIPGIDGKAYVMRACERLKAGEQMDFATLEDLEIEVLIFGNNNIGGAFHNTQPRPLSYSRVCGLSA